MLDHKNGNRKDNTADNLQYLCPNCESQLPTRGGGNKGRLEREGSDSYTMLNRDGTREYVLHPKADGIIFGGSAETSFSPIASSGPSEETSNPASLKRIRRKRRAP